MSEHEIIQTENIGETGNIHIEDTFSSFHCIYLFPLRVHLYLFPLHSRDIEPTYMNACSFMKCVISFTTVLLSNKMYVLIVTTFELCVYSTVISILYSCVYSTLTLSSQ